MTLQNTKQLDIELDTNFRPTYHFLPKKNWMNDPNGPIFFNGEYHLFYQYNPNGPEWGDIHWGHAKSRDMVNWEHLPIALSPSSQRGEHHCFSGCTVLNGETPTIFYTSVGDDDSDRNHVTGAEQWIATSTDGMITWKKPATNPVMTKTIHGDLDIKEWRDPFVWNEDGSWYMVLGGQHEDKGCVTLYRSDDLQTWDFLNILYKDTGPVTICECPNFFKMGDRYLLLFSPIYQEGHGEVVYITGMLNKNNSFTPLYKGTLDYSGIEGYYAPTSFIDEYGERILLGWITEHSRGDLLPDATWSGVQAIPRVLSLTDTHHLQMKPIKSIEKLRTTHDSYQDILIINQKEWHPDATGDAIELLANIEWEENQGPFSIRVLQSPDKTEETEIKIDPRTGRFELIREKSSQASEPSKKSLSGNIDLSANHVTLHVFIDHSVIEIFINNEKCISTRVYPISQDSVGVGIQSDDFENRLNVKSLDIWQLKPISTQ